MTYLILQILLYIILAALVGFFTGWFFRGHGLISKLTASDNQWRVKNHILQDENDRLQSDLDDLKSGKGTAPATIDSPEPEQDALSFKSAANRQPQDDIVTSDSVDQPLARLRAQLALIEEEEEEKLKPISSESESHNDPQYHHDGASKGKDDLQQIKGIDANIEALLNSMGVYRYDQVAHFSAENVVWVDEYMKFKEEIEKNDWVGQARALMND